MFKSLNENFNQKRKRQGKSMQKKVILSVVICLFLLNVCVGQEPVPDKRGYIVKVGDKIKDFEMKILDGSTKKLSQFDGSVIVLNFFASW
jgi:hypothetical protein